MRNLVLLMCVAVLLGSCRTRKPPVTEIADRSISLIDTTNIVTDSSMTRTTVVDSIKSEVISESEGAIEFVDGGGKVTVTPDGVITLDGVKSISGVFSEQAVKETVSSSDTQSLAAHTERQSGVSAKEDSRHARREENPPDAKWHQRVFIRIGQGVCIAALLWLLFLYLKRKF